MTDCVFCKIASGKQEGWIIYKDEKVTAFLDAYPVTEGHVIIAFNKHIDDIYKLEEADFLHLNKVAKIIAARMKKKLKSHFVNIIIAESVIKHAFLHVIPRTDYDLMGIVPDMENKRTLPKEVMNSLKKKLGE